MRIWKDEVLPYIFVLMRFQWLKLETSEVKYQKSWIEVTVTSNVVVIYWKHSEKRKLAFSCTVFFPKNFINFLSFCFILWFFSSSLLKYFIHYWWQLMTFNGSLVIRMSEQMVFITINLSFLTLINIFQLQCRGFRNTKAEIWEDEHVFSHNESTEKLQHHRFGHNYI